MTIRKVRHNGEIKWRGRLIYLSAVLAKDPVGLTLIDNDYWALRYSFQLLGYLDGGTGALVPAQGWQNAKQPKT